MERAGGLLEHRGWWLRQADSAVEKAALPVVIDARWGETGPLVVSVVQAN